MPRLGWDEYFMGIAEAVAKRADCTRSQVGAIIVDWSQRIVSTGYNGSPPGQPGCLTDGACPRGRKSKEELPGYGSFDDPDAPGFCIAVHAEANAIIYAGKTTATTMYVTREPCAGCDKLIRAAGIARVCYPGGGYDTWRHQNA